MMSLKHNQLLLLIRAERIPGDLVTFDYMLDSVCVGCVLSIQSKVLSV